MVLNYTSLLWWILEKWLVNIIVDEKLQVIDLRIGSIISFYFQHDFLTILGQPVKL